MLFLYFCLYHKKIFADTITPVEVYLKIRDVYPNSLLLENSDYMLANNNYSFICFNQIGYVKIKNNEVTCSYPGEEIHSKMLSENEKVSDIIHDYLDKFQTVESNFKFLNNGLFGFMSHESVKYFDSIIRDAYKRLISPSIEREIRAILTEKADLHAIEMFARNLEVLLLQPPLKEKRVLGIDPAFRTGCKMAVITKTGAVEKIDIMYPTEPRNDIEGSSKKLDQLLGQFEIDQIVIGNGTASRETESFIAAVIKKVEDRKINFIIYKIKFFYIRNFYIRNFYIHLFSIYIFF